MINTIIKILLSLHYYILSAVFLIGGIQLGGASLAWGVGLSALYLFLGLRRLRPGYHPPPAPWSELYDP